MRRLKTCLVLSAKSKIKYFFYTYRDRMTYITEDYVTSDMSTCKRVRKQEVLAPIRSSDNSLIIFIL